MKILKLVRLRNGRTSGVLVFAILMLFLPQSGLLNSSLFSESQFERAVVSRVIDGDTIVLQGYERVRFIGIDTPENGESGFHEARLFVVEKIAQNNGIVYLQPSGANTDRFGRLRRYVWLAVPQNSADPIERQALLLNQMLLDTGHAVVWGN